MELAVTILIGLSFLGSAVVSLPNLAVEWAKRSAPEVVFSVETSDSLVALSIDDGPSSSTPEILDVLERQGARATFFLIGENVDARPDAARRIREAGHELGHHMMEDRPSKELAHDAFDARFDAMDRRLDALGGGRLFRPGSGWYDDRMIEVAADRGYRTVLGSVYPFDAHLPAPGLLSWYVRQNTVPGSILVLHDGPERGGRTAEVLRSVLPELRRRGFRIVTVSELLDAREGCDRLTSSSGSRRAPAPPASAAPPR